MELQLKPDGFVQVEQLLSEYYLGRLCSQSLIDKCIDFLIIKTHTREYPSRCMNYSWLLLSKRDDINPKGLNWNDFAQLCVTRKRRVGGNRPRKRHRYHNIPKCKRK